MKNIGIQIRERRKSLKITQQELADLAGISINTVVAAERGQGDPKISTYLAICNVLGLKLTTVL
ncbi:MAG: helix-turn-helix transcriptional regulator [Bacteroidales bacterium]|nr:helix-turn-helix transcriptional regulator [Bacteroidales bacterium]